MWHAHLKQGAVPTWFGWILTIGLSFYIFAVFMARSTCFLTPSVVWSPLGLLTSLLFVVACFNRVRCVSWQFRPVHFSPLMVGLIIFFVQLSWLLYMGPLSIPDVEFQIAQGDSLRFSDWHPLLHTWFLWGLMRIWHSLWFLAIVQISLFALILAWTYKTIARQGYLRIADALFVFLLINPANFAILRCPIKDVAFMLAVFGSLTCLINFNADPDWGTKFFNQFLMGFLLFVCTFVRHNGILFSVPIIVMLPFIAKKCKKCVSPLFVVAFCMIFSVGYIGLKTVLFRQGVYVVSRCAEGRESEKYGESVGLIMTGLTSLYFTSYDKTPESVRDLMDAMGASKCQSYAGDYNSFKFRVPKLTGRTPSEILSEKTSLSHLLRMLYDGIRSDAVATLGGIRDVTSLVWDPFPHAECSFNVQTYDFRNCWLMHVLATMPLCWFFTSVGFGLLVMIFLLTWGWIRKGGAVLVYVLPIVCYNFGTMLLLCGNDWRFFYAMVVAVPISAIGIVMLSDVNCRK